MGLVVCYTGSRSRVYVCEGSLCLRERERERERGERERALN